MRAFVAVEITNYDALESIKKIQSEIRINAKPIEIQNLHFTLLFLGDVRDEMLTNIKNALNAIEFTSFSISFTNLGVFPRPASPRIIWLGVDQEGAKNLTVLASKIVEVLAPLGFKPDKPFKPHLTIFRIKNKINNLSYDLKRVSSLTFGNQLVSEIKLKKSVLTPTGPIYSDLQVVKAV